MRGKKLTLLLAGCLGLTMMAGCGKSGNPAEALKERYSQYVDLGTYKGVHYTPTETPVTSEDVDAQVNQLVTQNGKKIEKKAGTAMTGDTVNIDYVGTVDGVEFDGGSTKGAGTEITLGSSGYVSGFDDQIVGHTPGETFDVKVTFPENYGKEALNGKPAVFKTTLNYIVSTEYPELTDELVAEHTDYKTVAEYRAAKEAELVKSRAESDLETDKDYLMDEVLEVCAAKQYPQAELEERIKELTEQIQSAAQSYGMTLDQYLMAFGYDADGFQEEIRTSVEKYMKRKMVICAIAEKEDIGVTKQEADEKIQELLKSTGLSDVNTLNQQTGYKDEDYYYIVLEDKVVNFVYENAEQMQEAEDTTPASTEAGSEAATEAATEAAGAAKEAASESAVAAAVNAGEASATTEAATQAATQAATEKATEAATEAAQ